jgi:hypothetical protein
MSNRAGRSQRGWLRIGALLAVALTWTGFAAAQQQVTEADRQAARELFQQGYQLQTAGNYAEALERFSRAQAVFSAPTNLLHIAECQAQLGQLVESAETYRGLISLNLPPGAPPAFGAAQTQGKAELQQVEARIPKIRIEVAPANPPGLGVAIDDQIMNVALVGVDRPIDPGPHRIVVVASGYNRVEASVVIKEKEPPKIMSFKLQANGLLTGPTPLAPYPGVGPGGVLYPQPYAVPSVQPYGVIERPWTPPPKKDYSNLGFFFGVRVGAAIPTSLGSGTSTGPGGGLEGYFRFAHKWFVGVYGEHDFYRGPNGGTPSSNDVGAAIGFTTNPEGVGFTMDLTFGYRWVNEIEVNNTNNFASGAGAEGGLGAGIWIAVGKSFRIVPRVDIAGGSLESIPGQGGYAAFFAGVSGYFNIDLGSKAKAAPTTVSLPALEAPPATPTPR